LKKGTLLLLTSILVLASLSMYFIFPNILSLPPAPSVTKLHLNFYDYLTGDSIKGLAVNFNMRTRTEETFTISGVSEENGSIIQTFRANHVAFPVSARNISISGYWVLEECRGENAWYAADEMWTATNPQAFSFSSQYIFDDGVHLSHDRDGSTLNLKLDFYLATGKVIAIYDPIPEVRYYDWHLRINVLSRNFVGFARNNYAVVPIGKPLMIDAEVNYMVYQGQPLHWKVQISVDVRNRTFVDLTPSFVRAYSSAQIDVLTRSLDNLAPYGFKLTEQYEEIGQISSLYDLAIEGLENEDDIAFSRYWQRAMYSCRDLFTEITGMYANAVGWTPGLIMIFLFFSSSLSRLISDRKSYSIVLFFTLFLAVFLLFFFTQPYLRLFISNPAILVQSYTFSLLITLLVQLLPFFVVIILMFFAQIRNLIWETFEVGIRNLRRRRLKTGLALFTVLVVSASAMSFLTITTEKPIFQVPYEGIKPIVDSGLVIFKITSQVIPETRAVRTFNVPIQQHEIEWFSEHEWVEAMNVYGVRKVGFARADGFVIENFSIFNLVIVNSSFIERYQNVSDALKIDWFGDIDRNVVIVGSEIAEAYDLEVGSEVLIEDGRYFVKSIVDEETAVEKLKDIDGDLFLFKVFDPSTRKIDGESFIFGTLKDFGDSSFSKYRVSIILKSEYGQNATQIAKSIQDFGYDFGEQEDYSYVVTYSVRAIASNSVYIVYSKFPKTAISGQWQTQTVPIIIAILVLVANAMGTVGERKSEVRTIYTIGASPLRVGLIFVTEGLVLGIIGGIFGYVFGYLLVKYANVVLPALVEENIVGGVPFTIAILTATSASLLGCLLPSLEAVKIAVPSGRLKQRIEDIMYMREGKAHLKIPIKIDRFDRNLFGRFLEGLADKYSFPNCRFMSVSSPHVEETWEGIIYEIMVNYVQEETASFLISILAKPNEDLKVTIQPIGDARTRKIGRWNREHKNNVRKLSPVLREEILRFTEFKRKSYTSERFGTA